MALPASFAKSPLAAFNLHRPQLICCGLPGTQSPNKSCSLKLRRIASQQSHSSRETVSRQRQRRRSEKPLFKSKTIAASLHQLDVGSTRALLKNSSSPKPTRSSKVKNQTMLYEVIDLQSINTLLPFREECHCNCNSRDKNQEVPSSPHLPL